MTIDPALSAINLPGSGRNSDSLPRERRPSPLQLTEVSYTAYSPSPSDIALWKNKRSGIAGWNQDVPTHAKSPDTSLEPAMAARSATWASTIGTSRPQRTDPSRIRSPPIPLLALPPSPAPTSPPHHPPKLLPAAPGDFLGPLPSTRSTSHTEREAYLASALELPLDLIARVDSPVAPPPSPGSNVTTGRLGSLLGISRGKSQRVPSDTRSSHKSDVPRSEGGSIETGGTNRQEASRLTRCQTTSAVSGQGQETRLGSGNGYRSLGPSAKARQEFISSNSEASQNHLAPMPEAKSEAIFTSVPQKEIKQGIVRADGLPIHQSAGRDLPPSTYASHPSARTTLSKAPANIFSTAFIMPTAPAPHCQQMPFPRPILSRRNSPIDGQAHALGRRHRNPSTVSLTARFDPNLYPVMPASARKAPLQVVPESDASKPVGPRNPSGEMAHAFERHRHPLGDRVKIIRQPAAADAPAAGAQKDRRRPPSIPSRPRRSHLRRIISTKSDLVGPRSNSPSAAARRASKPPLPSKPLPQAQFEGISDPPRPQMPSASSSPIESSTGSRSSRIPAKSQSLFPRSGEPAVENSRPSASSSPPVGRRTDDDEHVSFEVPSGDRGRLRVSLAWLRGVGNRLDRKLPPLPPQPVASLPPVPPKSPSRSSGDRTRFTGAQDPSERASSSIPPSQADRPGELWYDPLYNMATRPTYPAGMYPMQTQPFAYPQPAMHFTPWNSHPHLMQPVPSAHPPGPVSINPPSTIVSPNFPQVPLHPPKGASYHPVSMMPVTNGGYPYPPLPRPPSMWRRMIGSQPAHDDPLRARRRQVPTGRAPTLVPPLVRPVRERPISPSRMNRFGGYTKYHRAPGPLRQLFTRRNDADRFLERQRQRRDPTMNYNLGRSRSYPVGQDANANSSRADGLFRPHSFAAGQIPRIDAQRQRERDSFAVREKEERRKQKATRRDEREARRSQRNRADRATEDNHRGVRTMVGDWMTRFRAAGRKDESRGRNGMNVIPWG